MMWGDAVDGDTVERLDVCGGYAHAGGAGAVHRRVGIVGR